MLPDAIFIPVTLERAPEFTTSPFIVFKDVGPTIGDKNVCKPLQLLLLPKFILNLNYLYSM